MACSLEHARPKIRAQLESKNGGVFTEAELREMLLQHRNEWGLTKSTSCQFRKF